MCKAAHDKALSLMKMMRHWHLLPTARKDEAVPSLCMRQVRFEVASGHAHVHVVLMPLFYAVVFEQLNQRLCRSLLC